MPLPLEQARTERQQQTPGSGWPLPSAVRLGSLPEGTEQELRFVQERLALFGKITFFISTMFLIVTVAADVLRHTTYMGLVGRTAHVVGTLAALGVWQLLRTRRNFTPDALLAFDTLGTLGICVAFVAMGHYSTQPYGFYTGMLAVTHVSISRAMIVPSQPNRTLALALASFTGFLVMRATLPLTPEMLGHMGSRGRGILEAALWSTAGTAVATVASRVIYGLHEKAREALQLGQYTLEEKIGEGGMGEIFRAHHAMLRRPTAVKLLLGDRSEEQLRRFEKEVQLTARLTHPNTISIFDYGRTPDGIFYYAMELLDGMTLEQLVDRHGPLPAGRVIHVLLQVCGALSEAHRIGLIHRDIKPANIFLCHRGDIPDFVKVLDFGLVRELSKNREGQSSVDAVVGTPLYMAPEAILEPERVDARADLYGLGGVAYFLATGTAPFSGKSVVEVCAHHLHTEPTPPSERAAVPPDLESVILACLAKQPERRPASARELAQALERCQDAQGWPTSEAEAWWAELREQEAKAGVSAVPTPGSGEQTRRTIVAADLEQRIALEQKRSA